MMENRQHHLSDSLQLLQPAELAELEAPERDWQPARVEVLTVVTGAATQTALVMQWASALA